MTDSGQARDGAARDFRLWPIASAEAVSCYVRSLGQTGSRLHGVGTT
ncbi:hypothetical protein ABIA96_005994 [Bradyrhizobium sp. LB11.1]